MCRNLQNTEWIEINLCATCRDWAETRQINSLSININKARNVLILENIARSLIQFNTGLQATGTESKMGYWHSSELLMRKYWFTQITKSSSISGRVFNFIYNCMKKGPAFSCCLQLSHQIACGSILKIFSFNFMSCYLTPYQAFSITLFTIMRFDIISYQMSLFAWFCTL